MPLIGCELAAPVDLRDLLRPGLERDPEALAIIAADGQLTWRELDEQSDRLARNHAALGLRPGDRVASLMPNRILLVVHYLACFRGGFVTTPLNYRYAPPEIDHALEVSGAQAIVAHAERGRDLAASQLAGTLPFGTITLEGQREGRPTLEELCTTDPLETELVPSAG